jgi:hypothetical protein
LLKSPLQLFAASITTSIAADAEVAIPNNSRGTPALFVLITTDETVGFMPIQSGATPALADMPLLVPDHPLVLNVAGYDALRIGFIAAAEFTVTPLENH